MMASKDDNKCKYAANGTEEEAEEAPPKKQKMIGGDDNDDDHSDDDDHSGNDSSSSSTDSDYSLEPSEEISSEEEMNIPISYEEELLIRHGCSDDRDSSNDEEESHLYFSDD
jgi:hypothetical protein